MGNQAINQWNDCKEHLKSRIPPALYRTFIDPLVLFQGDQNHWQFLAPRNTEALHHIESRYLPVISEYLKTTGFRGQVSIGSSPKIATVSMSEGQSFRLHNDPAPTGEIHCKKAKQNTFFPSNANALMVHSILNGDGPDILVLSGPTGSGKTHLSRCIVEQKTMTGNKARYLSLEEFLSEFSIACKKRATVSWRKELRSNALLILDDFHYLKPTAVRASEEIQNLIDDFQNKNQAIVFTSAAGMSNLSLPGELKSRIQSLPQIQLEYPDQTNREKILKLALMEKNLMLPEGVIHYIAQRISKDIRLLKSTVDRMKPFIMLLDKTKSFSEQKLDQILGDLYSQNPDITPAQILEVVADFFQIDPSEICSNSRRKTPSMARHLVAWLCTEEFGWNQKDTANLIGKKDHTSVIHARKKISELLKTDLFFANNLSKIKSELHRLQA